MSLSIKIDIEPTLSKDEVQEIVRATDRFFWDIRFNKANGSYSKELSDARIIHDEWLNCPSMEQAGRIALGIAAFRETSKLSANEVATQFLYMNTIARTNAVEENLERFISTTTDFREPSVAEKGATKSTPNLIP